MTLPATYVSTAQLEQTIRHATNGAVLSLDKRRKALGYDKLQEIGLQVQVPIWGVASTNIAWTSVGVPFDIEFVYAPNQRDIPFTLPHFIPGAVCQGHTPLGGPVDPNNPNSYVLVTALVEDWSRDIGKDIINGAQIGIGVTVGAGAADVEFAGYVHLTFQGYGAPVEDVAALDVGQ